MKSNTAIALIIALALVLSASLLMNVVQQRALQRLQKENVRIRQSNGATPAANISFEQIPAENFPGTYKWFVNGEQKGTVILHPDGTVTNWRGEKKTYRWQVSDGALTLVWLKDPNVFTRIIAPGIYEGARDGSFPVGKGKLKVADDFPLVGIGAGVFYADRMASEPIQYFNRYTGRTEQEDVYGDRFLRWTYGNPLGRLSLHALVKRAAFSRWYGRRMDAAASRAKVAPFISNYKVSAEEFADKPDSYRTFNEFFYRKLKLSARPIDPDPKAAVFPADGRHFGFQDVSALEGIFVKGAVFDLRKLLGDDELARRFHDGAMVLSRLCPVDYHRFHFPVSGVPSAPRFIDGPLFSVNPIALRRNIHIFTENKRAVTRIDSPEVGLVAMLEIGATCVGSFDYTFTPGQRVEKGAEKGYFKFGGSSTITLFERGRIQLAEDLIQYSQRSIELYARMGDRLGMAIPQRRTT